MDRPYPHVHEWTPRSRQADLEGYGVWAEPVDIEVTVMGVNVEPLIDILRIEARPDSMIIADWINRDDPEGTNWVAWSKTWA